jgi:uncharacterized protein (DUF302 family)
MSVRSVTLERVSVTAPSPFETVLGRLHAALGHPDMRELQQAIGAAKTLDEVEAFVAKRVGASGLMEFARFDLGEVLRKDRGGSSPRMVRLLVGNPLVMRAMAEHVPDAGSYAPATILIVEGPDGVRLSYDRMASLLAPYGSADASRVARDLDEKIERLLSEVAGASAE